ncbi:isoleucyl-tRNA synthetase family protein [Tritrichomonas foetus]|uniref:isoleucine--tRNA ligase n=1 Tax=Tritrichomonas foetus TaxID=1144522 RepID=A0A1J4J8I9_9EUKA|nr:isoleucyl-tRNA synthetase family protein [Tritrichomonas foetus]|eukprot:OHS95009.1 isoleucyl-tRNA synthetase family protein [Tritrichomonas foetus]
MKDRICELFNIKDKKSYTIEEEFLGSTLAGIQYEPLFPYFASWADEGAFRVIEADYVSNEDGTGIVHTAPGFGEDDFKASMAAGIIKKGGKIVCPIDDNGCFTAEVKDYEGVYVKTADKQIIERLKAEGKLIKLGTISHKYPYCWRSDTPLLYRAIPSWFVRVEANRERLIKNTLETEWVPQSIRDGRFVEWLKSARDWAISRNRYWGTPIPIWTDDEYSEFVVVGSIAELEELTGAKNVTDLHMHKIDDLTITSKTSGKVLHRIPEVFDCWFESGSMPFSQNHIPFSGKEFVQADFIAEGLDQTRGWFYTLTILSTLLDHTSPFKHLIVNGLILAEDGKKMSKRLHNYPDPENIMEECGADALRLYLINSPAVHADPMRFKGDGVKQVVRDVMLPWLNSIKFFVQQVLRHGNKFHRNVELALSSTNTLDKWILSRLHRIIKFVHNEMSQYRLYTVLPELVKFIDEMTNWYVRLNRDRLKSAKDAETGLAVLYEVLLNISLLMAPFAPFFSEYAYQVLKPGLDEKDTQDSVHYLMLPTANEKVIDSAIERKVGFMQSAICVARAVRDRRHILVRRPLAELIIVCSKEIKEQIHDLEPYILSELHVLKISFDTDEKKYVKFQAVADGRLLGKRLGKKFAAVNKALKSLHYETMASLYEKSIEAAMKGEPAPSFEVEGETVNTDEVKLIRELISPDTKKFDGGVDGEVCALCNIEENDLIKEITVAREIRNRVQQARKKLGLQPTDQVQIFVSVDQGNEVWNCLHSTKEEVTSSLGLKLNIGEPTAENVVGALDFAINSNTIKVTIIKE